MTSIVEKCKGIIDGDEVNFIETLLDCNVACGHRDDCVLLVESLAQAFPEQFVRAVGAYLHDCVEVAS